MTIQPHQHFVKNYFGTARGEARISPRVVRTSTLVE